MKRHRTIHCLSMLAVLTTVIACEDRIEFREPTGGDTTPPATVTDVQVENLAGKAKITYKLPKSSNLLYVKAEYTLGTGEQATAKSSYYTDSIVVDGFADTLEHEVTLYAVSRNERVSDPVKVTVRPFEAPFQQVFKTINVVDAFGGYNLEAHNAAREHIAIMVMRKNEFGQFEVDNFKSIFTRTDEIVSKIRNIDTLAQDLAIFVKDSWGNASDTLYTTIKPMYEAKLDPALFRAYELPGDAPQVLNGSRIEYMWDGRYGWPWASYTHQVNGGPDPHIITFDTGVLAKVSRVWIRTYNEGHLWYYLGTMKRFEIYGSENPSRDGSLDESWVLLGNYEVVKPSGLPYGNDSAEDQATAAAGFSWEVDLNAPKVRYIRIRCLENFAGATAQCINELEVYGSTL